jgi:SAM-dependent methyltransferase
MRSHSATQQTSGDVAFINRTFYDALWSNARLERADRFNTWPIISGLLPSAAARLEIGPGLRPRLPVAGTHFIDISAPAVDQLNAGGGIATLGDITVLPFSDQQFDLVCAFDVIEHITDDQRVFGELSRVLKDNGVLICSVPVHARLWTAFDDWVGHVRRYDPPQLLAILAGNRLTVEQTAVYGMQPTNPWVLKSGMWWLNNHRRWAMFWYNWVGMPLALLFQKPLTLVPGVIDTAGVDEVLLVCRRGARS